MKIVILDGHAANPGDLPMDEIKALGNVVFYDETPDELVIARSADADAILLNKVLITADIMDALPRLKYIGIQATGYNVVDTVAARQRGIVVTNVPAYSTMSVAQQVFAHLLNVTNRVEHYADEVRHGAWAASPCFCYWNTPLVELDGKTLGIIGYGNIGQQVERIALTFGMRVLHASARCPQQMYAMLSDCDIVSLHCPASDATMAMVNDDFLARMKRGAVLINTARGQVVDEQSLVRALDSGKLQAYCADTMSQEPPTPNNALMQHPHAFFTPHNAWATREARTRLLHVVADNLKAYINGHPQNIV